MVETRINFISDVHERLSPLDLKHQLPFAEGLVIAGDLANTVRDHAWYQNYLDHCYSVRVANSVLCMVGNHDEISPDPNIGLVAEGRYEMQGVKLYTWPWTPEHMDYAWQLSSERADEAIHRIPESGIDVLVLHGAPHRDYGRYGFNLRAKIERMKGLQAVIFGHDHEAHGMGKIGDAWVLPVPCFSDESDRDHVRIAPRQLVFRFTGYGAKLTKIVTAGAETFRVVDE